ncbi:MAG: hypothetical protein PGN07_08045 [Aeromicrobium erythreum]
MSSELTPEERARRLRAARLLGDLAPEVTRDETSTGWSEREAGRDAEMLRDRPPHHGS